MDEIEKKLLSSFSQGDEQAFSSLFLYYFPRVRRFITGLLQDEEIAEDLSQDIFVKMWMNRNDLKEIENLNAYLYKSSRNAVYQYLRHDLLIREYSKNQQELFQRTMIQDDQNPEENFYVHELELLILATVENMPPQRKKIYEMSRHDGKSNEEIANILSINKRTVENHLTQALSDIRKIIRNLYIFI